MKRIKIHDIDLNKINGLGVYELRNLARSLGIQRPTTLLRADLIDSIRNSVREGKVPMPSEGIPRGRPPREFTLDFGRITESEDSYFTSCIAQEDYDDDETPACCNADKTDAEVRYVSGYVHEGQFGNAQLIGVDLIGYQIPAKIVSALRLTVGDFIEAKAALDSKLGRFALTEVMLIGGKEPKPSPDKSVNKHFDTMEGVRPNKSVSCGSMNFKLGQRVLVKSGKQFDRIEHIAEIAKIKDVHTIALLIEEIDDTAKYIRECGVNDVYLTKVSFSLKKQVVSCLLALFKAKQLAEEGKDVILVVDSMRKLFRLYNNSAFVDRRLLLAQVNITPLADLKSYFQASRQLENGGSLTVVAYTNTPNNSMEEYVLNEFSDIANVVFDF